MAAILSVDTTGLNIINEPSIPMVKVQTEKVTMMSDDDKTDDELELPQENEIEMRPQENEIVEEENKTVEESYEPPQKKTKLTPEKPEQKEESKKKHGIEIPLSLVDDYDVKPQIDIKPEPKRVTPKKEIKVEKKEMKKEKVNTPFDPDEPTIVVEYINLIKVKEETSPSQPISFPQTGYNA